MLSDQLLPSRAEVPHAAGPTSHQPVRGCSSAAAQETSKPGNVQPATVEQRMVRTEAHIDVVGWRAPHPRSRLELHPTQLARGPENAARAGRRPNSGE